MANKTVYPFGTDGQLPSNIGIIDDLTTGGVNKALSAQQGVVLKGMLEVGVPNTDIKEEITWVIGGINKTTGAANTDTDFIRPKDGIMSFDDYVYISYGEDEGDYFIRVAYYDDSNNFVRFADYFGNVFIEPNTKFWIALAHYPVATIININEDTVFTKLKFTKGGYSQPKNYVNYTTMDSGGWAHSDTFRVGSIVEIPSGVAEVTVKPSVGRYKQCLFFLDSTKNYLSQFNRKAADYSPRTVEVPEGAAYARVQASLDTTLETWLKDDSDNILWQPQDAVRETMSLKEAVEELIEGGGGGGSSASSKYDDLLKGGIYDDAMRQFQNSSLVLMHLSDLHGDATRLSRAIAFGKRYAEYIDNTIQTGDLVVGSWGSGIDFYTAVEGSENILNVIGNHDSASSNSGGWSDYTAAQCYERYISPFVSNWGVTIGTNVCYYYKDYDNDIRLIVLDRLHFDATQKSWFLALLANSSSKKIIIASHSVPAAVTADKDCNMDVFWNTVPTESYMELGTDVLDAVDDFIDGGGTFICWLGGHTHYDVFRKVTNYPNQLSVNVGATALNAIEQTYAREAGTRSEDNFNIFSVDVARGTLSVQKIGCSRDRLGRSTFALTYDYINHVILTQI